MTLGNAQMSLRVQSCALRDTQAECVATGLLVNFILTQTVTSASCGVS